MAEENIDEKVLSEEDSLDEPKKRRVMPKSYADNFRHDRISTKVVANSWIHSKSECMIQMLFNNGPEGLFAVRFMNAPVAQGIEHRISNPQVGGSNPPGRAIFSSFRC